MTKQKEVRGALVLRVFRRIVFTLFFIFTVTTVFAATNSKTVKEVESYLNNIKFLKANFLQDDVVNSQLSEGMFYLSRPGKLRIDYLNPFEASLYTDSRTTIYYDRELNEVSSVRTVSTPLHFLLRTKISFNDQSFSIVDTDETVENISISFKEKGKEDQGILMLRFTKNPLKLVAIRLINGLDQEIEMVLFNDSTEPLANSLFEFKRPKGR